MLHNKSMPDGRLFQDTEQCTLHSNAQDIVDLLGGCFLLHQEKLSYEAWLQTLSRAVGCEAAACVRWTVGKPDYDVSSAYGDFSIAPAEWKSITDRIVRDSSFREAGFIEDFVAATPDPSACKPAFHPSHALEVVLDWDPACVVIVMLRDKDRAPWTSADREQIRYISSHLRESALTHKKLDQQRYIGNVALDILNSSPRGIIALSDNGVIQLANARAAEIMDRNDGIRNRDGKLVIDDPRPAKILKAHLNSLSSQTGTALPDMDWNLSVRKRSDGPEYQLILGSIKLRDWNLESRASDRLAIVYLHDPVDVTAPSIEQLRNFYGMTKAQAKLSRELYNGKTIAEAADSLHVSINTARSHLRGVYAKTGVRTQAELLGLLTSGLKSFGKHID